MISIRYIPTTLDRSARRKAIREYKQISDSLFEIERRFLIGIFETNYSYTEVYNAYLMDWRLAVERAKRVQREFIDIDEGYFTRNFAPIEQLYGR